MPVSHKRSAYLRQRRCGDVEPWAALNADPRVMEFYPQTLTQEESADYTAFAACVTEMPTAPGTLATVQAGSWFLFIKALATIRVN